MLCSYNHSLICIIQVGVGMSMEGIEQNPIVYDLMSEMAFQHKTIDVQVPRFYVIYPSIHSYLHQMLKIGIRINTNLLL